MGVINFANSIPWSFEFTFPISSSILLSVHLQTVPSHENEKSMRPQWDNAYSLLKLILLVLAHQQNQMGLNLGLLYCGHPLAYPSSWICIYLAVMVASNQQPSRHHQLYGVKKLLPYYSVFQPTKTVPPPSWVWLNSQAHRPRNFGIILSMAGLPPNSMLINLPVYQWLNNSQSHQKLVIWWKPWLDGSFQVSVWLFVFHSSSSVLDLLCAFLEMYWQPAGWCFYRRKWNHVGNKQISISSSHIRTHDIRAQLFNAIDEFRSSFILFFFSSYTKLLLHLLAVVNSFLSYL